VRNKEKENKEEEKLGCRGRKEKSISILLRCILAENEK